MPTTLTKRSAANWSQADRAAYFRAQLPDTDIQTGTRFVYVPDYRVDVLRRLAFPDWTDDQLRDTHAALDEKGLAAKSFDVWYPDADTRPVVLLRGPGGRHELGFATYYGRWTVLHAFLGKAATTVPAIVAIPPDLPPVRVAFDKTLCTLSVFCPGYDNGRVAVAATEVETGEPYTTLTYNLPDEPVAEDETFIKDSSENQGFLAVLEEAGVVRATGRLVESGYIVIPSALLLI